MKHRTLHILLFLLILPVVAVAQIGDFQQEKLAAALEAEHNNGNWGRDSTGHTPNRVVPWGQFMWTIDERLGNVVPAENTDTVVTNFQNWKMTDGMTGDYSYLGNTGSPRLNRIFFDRKTNWNKIVERGMKKDYSWNNSKGNYEGLYKYLIGF